MSILNVSFGRLAQMVEQLTLNQRVIGSIPIAPTNKFGGFQSFHLSFQKIPEAKEALHARFDGGSRLHYTYPYSFS